MITIHRILTGAAALGIALVGMPPYTTYAAAEAGIAAFGEALRRESTARVCTCSPSIPARPAPR